MSNGPQKVHSQNLTRHHPMIPIGIFDLGDTTFLYAPHRFILNRIKIGFNSCLPHSLGGYRFKVRRHQ